MQRHGNHNYGVRRKLGFECGDRLRQHAPKNIRRRAHAAILQQMNQFAQPAFIAAIGNGARENRLDAAAQSASRLAVEDQQSRKGKTAARRKWCRFRPSMGCMASRHSWQTGRREIFTSAVPQMRQSEGNKTAKRLSAIRPGQLSSDPDLIGPGIDSGSNRRARHCSFGLASPNSVPTTAEDGLRVARKKSSLGRATCDCLLEPQYSGGRVR